MDKLKTIKQITTVVLSALALAACNSNEPQPDEIVTGSENKIQITAIVSDFTTEAGTPDTRASINNTTGIGSFENNDNIGLWISILSGSSGEGNTTEDMRTLIYDKNNSTWTGFNKSWEDYGELSENNELAFCAVYPDPKAEQSQISFTSLLSVRREGLLEFEDNFELYLDAGNNQIKLRKKTG